MGKEEGVAEDASEAESIEEALTSQSALHSGGKPDGEETDDSGSDIEIGSLDFTGVVAGRRVREAEEAAERAERERREQEATDELERQDRMKKEAEEDKARGKAERIRAEKSEKGAMLPSRASL
jgi:hypothetical protein